MAAGLPSNPKSLLPALSARPPSLSTPAPTCSPLHDTPPDAARSTATSPTWSQLTCSETEDITDPAALGSDEAQHLDTNVVAQPPTRLHVDTSSDDQHLPTYDELQIREPGNVRFGRWKGWVEKRALERKEEKRAQKECGSLRPSRWDLGDDSTSGEEATLQEDYDSREKDRTAEKRLSKQLASISNPDADSAHSSPTTPQAFERAGLRVVPLTTSASIHPVGSTFIQQLPDQPLSACVLPLAGDMMRSLLVGTAQGLYVADLHPSLASSTLTNSSPTTSDAVIFPLISSLSVLKLSVFTNLPLDPSAPPSGLVMALVKDSCASDDSCEVRMWSLAALVNLSKWAVFTKAKEGIRVPSRKFNPAQSPTDPTSKRGSRAFVKSMFAGMGTGKIDVKGKGKASAPSALQQRDSADSFVLVDTSRDSGDLSRTSTPSALPVDTNSCQHQRNESVNSAVPLLVTTRTTETPVPLPRERSNSSASSLPLGSPSSVSSCVRIPTPPPNPPLEWASSSSALPLPKGHSPVVFFHLSEVPKDETGFTSSRQARRCDAWTGWLLLVVGTRTVVYVFESQPTERRTWRLVHQVYTPSTPRFASFVSTPSPILHRSTPHPTFPGPVNAHVSLLLGTRARCVLISLGDLSVRELELPGRTRSSSKVSSVGSTSLRAEVGRKRDMVANAVQAFVEARTGYGLPAGVEQGQVRSGMSQSRKMGSVPASGASGGSASSEMEVLDGTSANDWVGVSTFAVGRKAGKRTFHLFSKGRSTHLLPTPFVPPGAMDLWETSKKHLDSPGGEDSIRLSPLHTFIWPENVTDVRARVVEGSNSPGEQIIVVTAFTKTGVAVREGTLAFSSTFSTSSLPPDTRPTFTPSRRAELDEPGGEATFDFGLPVGYLAEGGLWGGDKGVAQSDDESLAGDEEVELDEAPKRAALAPETVQGHFMFSKGLSDWPLSFVG